MSNVAFNPKQADFVRMLKRDELKRINILEGAVRSGKTWVSLVAWAVWVATQPATAQYLMVGKTLTTLKRNCLEDLQTLVGSGAFKFSTAAKEGSLFGRKVLLEGAGDARSEAKIRGLTLMGAYCDELTTFPQDFFSMLLSRLSLPGAKLFATTNPDNPMHWLKTDFIDRAAEIDALVMKFGFDDNPQLPPEYMTALRREYTGVFYRRFILGEWCVAEGAIYPDFDPARHVVDALPPMRLHWVGVDYGHSNPTVFLLAGLGDDGRLYIIDEDIHKAADEGDQSPREYSRAMVRFLRKHEQGLRLEAVVVDPSAKGFIVQLREDGVARVRSANNAVLEGIQLVSSILSADLLRVHRRCKTLIGELQGYVWDDRAQARGEDKPVKVNDHAADGLRYLIMSESAHWKRRIANV